MSKQGVRLFKYAEMIKEIKISKRMNQRQLSEAADCTEVHISNIANDKATFSLDKLLMIINDNNICMDDFIDDSYRTPIHIKYEDKKLFNGFNDDEIILIVDFIREYMRLQKKNAGKGEKKVTKKSHTEKKGQKLVAQKVGKKIKELRLEKRISEKKMAEALNMKINSYRNIESGTATLYDNYVIIAKILEVPTSVIFSDFVKNKKTVVNFEVGELFENMNEKEKRIVHKIIPVVADALQNM